MIRFSARMIGFALIVVGLCAFTEVYAKGTATEDCETEMAEYSLQIADKQLEEIQMRFVLQKLQGEYREITGARQAIAGSIGRAGKAHDIAWYLNLGAGIMSLPRFLSKLSFLKGTKAAVTAGSTSALTKAGRAVSFLSRLVSVNGVSVYYKPKAEEALQQLEAAIVQLKENLDRVKQRHNEVKQTITGLKQRQSAALRRCEQAIEQEQAERIDVMVSYSRKKLRTQGNVEIIQDLVVVTNNSSRDLTIQSMNQALKCLDDGWMGGGAFPPSKGGKVYTLQVKAGTTAKVAEARWSAQAQGSRRMHSGSIAIVTNLGTFTSSKARYSNAAYIGHIPVAQWQ